MINFILYEDNTSARKTYIEVIEKFIGGSTLAYKITEIDNFNESTKEKISQIDGYKIYILDIEVPGKSGLDLAKNIRNSGDWQSQLIIVTNHEELEKDAFESQNLILSFISKFNDLQTNLLKSIETAYVILSCNKSIKYQKGGEIYQIPYNNILYIEKESNRLYCNIVTKGKIYETNKTLIEIERILKEDPRFLKVHRSYIINIDNVKKIDMNSSRVYFVNKQLAYFSRNYKRCIKDRLLKTI